MEWEGALLHGFVLVTQADAQDSEHQVETDPESSLETDPMADAIEQDGTGATTPPSAAPTTPPASTGAPAQGVRVHAAEFPELGDEEVSGSGQGNLGLLAGVELEVTVELGRRRMPLADILRLTSGSVLELEKLVGEPLQIFANNRFIAEGEAVVIDEQFGVRITALASRGVAKAVR
ncbi:MAG: flagellar motor switch protein FliN [Rhodothermales bacterium]|nr:flagellar motor switch protein FliN [Rhodothermales bacterium]